MDSSVKEKITASRGKNGSDTLQAPHFGNSRAPHQRLSLLTSNFSNRNPFIGNRLHAIDPVGLSFDIVSGAVEWGMLPVTDDTDEILSNRRERGCSKKLHDAKAFLREQIEGKEPVDSEEIFRRARGCQISDNRLRDAKRELGIETSKSGFQGRWLWSWPDSTRMGLLGSPESHNYHL